MEVEVIWTGLRAPTCRRRSCFYERVVKYHEFRSDGSAATGIGGIENRPHLPVTKTRIFKTCGQYRYGCPSKWVQSN